jgi:hypothetical protein
MERDELIRYYFSLGYEYRLIVCFLHFKHGIGISLRQLKRVLRRLGLKRRVRVTRALLSDAIQLIQVSNLIPLATELASCVQSM